MQSTYNNQKGQIMKSNIRLIATCFAITLMQSSMAQQQQSFEEKYQGLQKSPSYQNMSFIAIAATQEDLRAIRYFAPHASRDELIAARAILENKINLLREDLKQAIPRDTRDQVEKTTDRDAIKARIRRLAEATQRLSEIIAHKS